ATGKDDHKPNPREIDDHIFLSFEFPGRNHPDGANKGKDESDVVVVSYSSISTNGFEQYGECVMGSRGTMVVEGEQKVFLYTEKDPAKKGAADPKATTVTAGTTAGGKRSEERRVGKERRSRLAVRNYTTTS